MAMRTYDYFACPNGHQGEEKTIENDQPYSKSWNAYRPRASKAVQMAPICVKFVAYQCPECQK